MKNKIINLEGHICDVHKHIQKIDKTNKQNSRIKEDGKTWKSRFT